MAKAQERRVAIVANEFRICLRSSIVRQLKDIALLGGPCITLASIFREILGVVDFYHKI